jgi:Holliday junction DNA helicase RuvB
VSRDKINKNSAKEEAFLDQTLRPSIWEEYIGQKNIKENLQILLRAAKERSHPPEHIMFYGPPGLGKTTLAHLVAKEIGGVLKVTSGPTIEKVGDLASIITNLNAGDILFVDEIHRLNKSIEEVLYPAMESGNLNIILGKGPSARTIQLELPPFTLVAATTRIAMVSAPLRSRFSGGVFKLDFYTEDDIKKILSRSSKILGVEPTEKALSLIAQRSRYTPRTANYLLKRCRDYAQIHKRKLDEKTAEEAMNLIGVDEFGLLPSDRELLGAIIDKFKGGPVGLSTISAAMSEDEGTIEEYNEPYLLQIGFLERTPRGRTATDAAYKHMARIKTGQKKLL